MPSQPQLRLSLGCVCDYCDPEADDAFEFRSPSKCMEYVGTTTFPLLQHKGLVRKSTWLELALMLGTHACLPLLQTLHVDVYSASTQRASEVDVNDMVSAIRNIMNPGKVGFDVYG